MDEEREQKKTSGRAEGAGGWDLAELRARWTRSLEDLAGSPGFHMPLKRLRYQAEEDPEYGRLVEEWPRLDREGREKGWQELMECVARAAAQVLPVCVGSGECCRHGSPSLFHQDLELVRGEEIPWRQLVTLRPGERARAPGSGQPVDLSEEHIKIREDPETGACVFYDDTGERCRIYVHRPVQCRAQACWDPGPARELLEEARLSRSTLFAEVPVLRELVEEHDRRWPFAALREAMDGLHRSAGEEVEGVIRLLAEEASFRGLVAQRLSIPEDVLDFLFGRSFVDLVPLFGLQVVTAEDGTRTLRPLGGED